MKVAIIGGTGYGAAELIRLLQFHPYTEVEAVISHSNAGANITEFYPHMQNVTAYSLEDLQVDKLAERVEFVFFAAPPGVARDLLPQFLAAGVKGVDLSGDFRLHSGALYSEWYGMEAAEQGLLEKSVYGLSEQFAAQIKEAQFVANPGCYPTATLLGLLPLLAEGKIDPKSIIVDAKSGVSGAGRGQSQMTHFSEMNENFKAYKIGSHKHIPEIEQTIQAVSNNEAAISFTTHLVPMTRGIMSTIYADSNQNESTQTLLNLYQDYYLEQPFVRIRPEGIWPATKEVYGSNFCDIGLHADTRTGRIVIVSVIDNLVKGAAGQAIQNMNIMQRWQSETGLLNLPVYP